MICKQTRFLERRYGATSVEFAMTIPILLLLVFGGLEFGRASMLRHTADHAAYLGARQAITPGATVEDARVQAAAHLDAHGINGYEINVSPDPIGFDTTLVEVTVSFPASDNSFVVPEYLIGDITGHVEMLTERPPALLANAIPELPLPPAPEPNPPGPEDPPGPGNPPEPESNPPEPESNPPEPESNPPEPESNPPEPESNPPEPESNPPEPESNPPEPEDSDTADPEDGDPEDPEDGEDPEEPEEPEEPEPESGSPGPPEPPEPPEPPQPPEPPEPPESPEPPEAPQPPDTPRPNL